MSPEQARGEELDTRSDLFSLGLVLLEMATGKAPFAGEFGNQARALVSDDQPAPIDLNRGVSRTLGRILHRALAKQRGDRYQTASEFLNDLRRVAATRRRRPAYAAILLLGTAAAGSIALFASRPPASGPLRGDWIQLTNFSDSVVEPALSPNGELLTFLRGPKPFTTLGHVYVMRLPDGELVSSPLTTA
jgi:serine/threonine protein kinase